MTEAAWQQRSMLTTTIFEAEVDLETSLDFWLCVHRSGFVCHLQLLRLSACKARRQNTNEGWTIYPQGLLFIEIQAIACGESHMVAASFDEAQLPERFLVHRTVFSVCLSEEVLPHACQGSAVA